MDNEALLLWQELLEKDDFNPICNCDWMAYCVFCQKSQSDDYLYPGGDQDREAEHEENCIYLRIKRLVKDGQ